MCIISASYAHAHCCTIHARAVLVLAFCVGVEGAGHKTMYYAMLN